jgi:Transposase, Mutator family
VLIPILYLKGVSTGDFEEAVVALLGKDAGGLSASTIGRLKDGWSDEHARWSRRDLSAQALRLLLVDGIHVQARLEDDPECLQVNLLAHARERLHEEIAADYNDMIYAATREEIEARRKTFIRKWRLKHRAVADSLQEAGDGCSASRGCRRASGAAFAPPMPSSGCTRSSNAGSKPRPFCHRPTPQPCCSGRCLLLAKSTCAKSTAGRRLPPSPSISQLTSQPDQIASRRWRARRANPNHIPDDTGCRFAIHSLGPLLY